VNIGRRIYACEGLKSQVSKDRLFVPSCFPYPPQNIHNVHYVHFGALPVETDGSRKKCQAFLAGTVR